LHIDNLRLCHDSITVTCCKWIKI